MSSPSPVSRTLTVLAVLLLVPSFALAATAAKPAAKAGTSKAYASKVAQARGLKAWSRADMDTTCSPCKDFNEYANGGWLAHHDIPPANSSWGSFSTLTERNQEILHQILVRDAADKKAAANSDEQKLGSYWCACMDSTAAGVAAVKALIDWPHGSSNAQEWATGTSRQIANLHDHGVGALFFFRSAQDPRNSDSQIANLGQGGLGLPDRDYYLRGDSAAVATRARYTEYVAKLLAMGTGQPAQAAHDAATSILAFETSLAKASMTNVQRRDPYATYHKMSVDSLTRLCPAFDWKAYLEARGLSSLDSVNVTQPDFFAALSGLFTLAQSRTIENDMLFHTLRDAAPMMGPDFADADFDFNRVLNGAEEQQPRWKRCVRWADRDLGDMLGKAYVKQEFPPAARERALAMVHDLEAALGDRIQSLEWMGPETRQKALEKLHDFSELIGYPKITRDYAGVTIGCSPTQSLLANHYACTTWEARRNLAKIGKPVDRGEWFMTAPTVNAFYSPSLNSINFPAGILQPPFFDPSWDDAVNYGAIGAVIGHEMSHGFDDHGRQFDGHGNLTDWWTHADAAAYKERADKVVNQFNGYTVLDTLHVNGRLTLGEDIGDLGGVAVAYHALEKALKRHPVGKIDGFTPQQRFFLAYARVWATKSRPAALRTQVLTNPHAPAMWRANGPLSNLPEFREAWGCKAGDPMVRADSLRARIW